MSLAIPLHRVADLGRRARDTIVGVAWLAIAQTFWIGPAQAQTIWLAPRAPYPPANIPGAVDLMDLFRPDAPWKIAAAHVTVLKLSTHFMAWVPDAQLATIVQDLNRRGIALAVESLSQNVVGEPACGKGVEGYGDPGQSDKIIAKIKRVSGTLSFVAMDEPLFFGHFYNSATACHSSVDNVAHRVSAIVTRYRAAFPAVQIGDIEPAGAALFPHWEDGFKSWTRAFQAAVGAPLAFIQIDADWNNPNHMDGIKKSAEIARANGLPLGVIYNGKGNDTSDQQWIANAKANIDVVESILGHPPDQAVFQTWVAYPARLLPETDQNSLTSLIDYYVSSRGLRH